MDNREEETLAFLQEAGWADAARKPIPGDASTRRYEKLQLGEKRAVLMDAPAAAESKSASPDASEEQRRALGYNAVARLAGPNMHAFTGVASELVKRGFAAPKVYAADIEKGLALLEDLGSDSFASVLKSGPEMESQLYEAAIDTLAAIYRSSFPDKFESFDRSWPVLSYDSLALSAETDLLLQWYLPETGKMPTAVQAEALKAAWAKTFKILDDLPAGLILRDFHAENLFWLPEREAVARVGLIDFQDALFGHPAYDLVSLLEDARRDVDPDLAEPMITRFCERAMIKDEESFRAAYAVLGAQRNAKILGIFVRLARRDNKPSYLNLLPRVEAHFQRNLAHSALSDVKAVLGELL